MNALYKHTKNKQHTIKAITPIIIISVWKFPSGDFSIWSSFSVGGRPPFSLIRVGALGFSGSLFIGLEIYLSYQMNVTPSGCFSEEHL